MKLLPTSLPWRITLAYAAGAGLWILLSDRTLELLGLPASVLAQISMVKGLAFVVVTSALLFVVTRRFARQQAAAEEAERETRLRWEFALNAAEDGIWDWDIPAGEVFFSARCQGMLGFDPTEWRGRVAVWWVRVHPDDWPAVNLEVERHLAGQTAAWMSEHRVRTKQGDYKWILTRGKVVERGPGGAARRMLGVVSDVTQRHVVESRLDAALAFAQTVLQSSPVGLIACKPDGTIQTVNPAVAEILGVPVFQLIAHGLADFEVLRTAGFGEAVRRAGEEGRETDLVADLMTPAGRRRVAARFVPFQHQGEARVLAVVQDETEKHHAMRELQLTRAALQAAPTGWLITDATGRIEWVNPAFTRLTGFPFKEVVGRTPRILRSGRHDAEFYARMWRTISAGEVWEGDMINRRRDGTDYHEHMVIAPVRTTNGAITHFVAMKQDITAERDLEQQLGRSQRLESIGMLASGLAHDLNNVLAPILLSMELLKVKIKDKSLQPALDVVAQSAQRGAGIVRQVLMFARGAEGDRAEVEARRLVKDVGALIEETFPRSIELRTELERDLGSVHGNLTQLHQVLLNLAVNARDAMPAGGVLTLSAANVEIDEVSGRGMPALRPGPHVVLRVADTGTGIAPDVLDHIFDPFFTTKPRGKGTGLGLSTVHGIVRSHGGAVHVDSALGAGTTMSVYLPRLTAPAPAAVEESAAADTVGGGRRVLVVDDEPAIREVAAAVLEAHGFEVVVARDGVEGVAAFEAGAPWHLAIVDRMMPRMDGLAFAAAVRRTAPRLPLVLMSGLLHEPLPGESAAPDLAALGIAVTLEKPFGEAELMEALRRALDRA